MFHLCILCTGNHIIAPLIQNGGHLMVASDVNIMLVF
nr:MAG TPA_asm: hypothetical protein [Caudoviricetes sp.]